MALDCLPLLDRVLSPLVTLLGSEQCQKFGSCTSGICVDRVQVCSVGRIKRPALSEARYHYCTLRPSSSEEEGSLGCVSKHASTGPSNTLGNIYALRSSTCCFYSTEHGAWSAVVSSKIAPSGISLTFDYIVAFLMLVSSHLGIDRLLDSMTSCVLLSPAKVPRQVPFLPDLSRETVLSIRNSLLGDFFIRDSLDAESTTVARESIDQGANNGGRVVYGYLPPALDSGSYNDPWFLDGIPSSS
ncbi:hypothetical protein H0G86_001121 [Trichoderma simmonsii]|uniref:Uncharacterized protein n=1 Tax=Trichoderma simmonsii TaxID=1491479 RepID=A0A8G0PAW3_9HYPO|nr:hypothetical protein H0G86_001121 [Trichoderma simmonsii]